MLLIIDLLAHFMVHNCFTFYSAVICLLWWWQLKKIFPCLHTIEIQDVSQPAVNCVQPVSINVSMKIMQTVK